MTRAGKPVARVLACAAAFVTALAVAPAGFAARTAAPVILSMRVSGPRPLPAGGAPVVVRVANASSCTFLRQYSAFSALYPYKTVSCASGRAAVVIPAISNSYKAPVHLNFEVRATGSGLTARKIVKVAQAAALSVPPPVVSIAPAPPPPLPPLPPSYSLSAN